MASDLGFPRLVLLFRLSTDCLKNLMTINKETEM